MLVSYLPFSAVNGVLGAIGASSGVGTHQLQWAGAGHICATVLIGMLAATAAAVGGLLLARRVR